MTKPRSARVPSAFSKAAKSRASSRSIGRPAGPSVRNQRRRPLSSCVGEQVEQDRQLGLVIEVAGDDLERVGVEDGQQLVVGEPEQVLEPCGAQNS